MEIPREVHDEFVGLLEDAVQYTCQEAAGQGQYISGETCWAIMECLAIAKQAEMQGLVTSAFKE